MPPLAAQAGTLLSAFPTCSVTRQSGRPVFGSMLICWVMHGGASIPVIRSAILCRTVPKLVSQIESRRPFAPNSVTSCATRTPGSPKWPSLAVHECEISGQGHELAPHEVSGLLGFFQCTVYGAGKPAIAAMATWDGSVFRCLSAAAVSRVLRRKPSVSSDAHPSYDTFWLTSFPGALRSGCRTLRWKSPITPVGQV